MKRDRGRRLGHLTEQTSPSWEGSPSFNAAMRLASAIASRPSSELTDEEEVVGRTLWGMLNRARPIVCPPEQLNAVPDEVFEDLAAAFSYASEIRLPFEVVYLDFCDAVGGAPPFRFDMFGGELDLQLRGVVAGENLDAKQTTLLPIIGSAGEPPEELGAVTALLEGSELRQTPAPDQSRDELSLPDGRKLKPVLYSTKAIMKGIDETPRDAPAFVMGARRHGTGGENADQLRYGLACGAAVAVRSALKVLYLLDSANVALREASVSRQVRRQAERKGAEIASVIAIRAPTEQEGEAAASKSKRDYSHRFEVRSNFAHYREGTWLFEHSEPDQIKPCPCCGRCRRIWRSAHIKGPADKPLVVKVRRVELDGSE